MACILAVNLLCNSVLTLVFSGIAIIHGYWSLGGNWGKQEAIPTTQTGAPLFKPSSLACVSVASIFVSFVFLVNWGHFLFSSLDLYSVLLTLMSLVFLVRVVGDFKYFGFFKRVDNTRFAKLDSNFYTPLCILIFIMLVIKLLIM